jgi:hypothetical protein
MGTVVKFGNKDVPPEDAESLGVKRRKAAVKVLTDLVESIERDNLDFRSFVVMAEMEKPNGTKRFMFADGGVGVSPDLYVFMEACRDNIKDEHRMQFFNPDTEYTMLEEGDSPDDSED